jgi:hypothetical protein
VTRHARAALEVTVSVVLALICFGLQYNIGVRPWAAALIAAAFAYVADYLLWGDL